jgi:methyl-accepting chemotaxis protein
MDEDMTIGRKISLLCALLVGFTIALGSLALMSMGRMETAGRSISTDALPGIYFIDRVESTAKEVRGAMLMHMASSDRALMAQFDSSIEQDGQKLKQLLKEYEKTIDTAADTQLFARIAPAFDRFLTAWQKPRELSLAAKSDEALTAFRSEAGLRRTPQDRYRRSRFE